MMELQLRQRLAEEVLARQTETMHGAAPVLPEKYLVQVGLQYLLLVVVQLQQNRHHRFGGLAAETAFVGQVEVLDQLLGQGTATLAYLAGRQVDPDGAGDGFR